MQLLYAFRLAQELLEDEMEAEGEEIAKAAEEFLHARGIDPASANQAQYLDALKAVSA